MTKENVLKLLGSMFQTFGCPKEVRSDSGPCFPDKFTQAMMEMGIDAQVSSAYHASGNSLAEEVIGNLKMALKKNGIGSFKEKLQELVSSLNNATSSLTGEGCASKCLLGFKPRYALPIAVSHLTDIQREAMLLAVKANKDKCASKINNISPKSFTEGDHVHVFDHKTKIYDGEGVMISAHPSVNGHLSTFYRQLLFPSKRTS